MLTNDKPVMVKMSMTSDEHRLVRMVSNQLDMGIGKFCHKAVLEAACKASAKLNVTAMVSSVKSNNAALPGT